MPNKAFKEKEPTSLNQKDQEAMVEAKKRINPTKQLRLSTEWFLVDLE